MDSKQLALPAPYGYKDGWHISLRSVEGFNLLETERTLVQFGCPRKIAAKAISCLRSSNRYDCVVSPEWFRDDGRSLKTQLDAEGVDVVVLGKPDPNDPGKTARRARQGGFFLGRFQPGTDGPAKIVPEHPLRSELIRRAMERPPQFDNLPRYLDDAPYDGRRYSKY